MTPVADLPNPYPIEPFIGSLRAVVSLPGSKSLTNRALLIAALATGRSSLTGVLFADDTEAMLECITTLGATVDIDRVECRVDIIGVGGSLPTEPLHLDARQSGTTARFIASALLLGEVPHVLDAAPQMRARPMATTFEALRELGADVVESDRADHLPASIRGATQSTWSERPTLRLRGDISSQFISGLLIVGPCLPHGLVIELTSDPVSAPYLHMTVATMRAFGAEVEVSGDHLFRVGPGGYRGVDHRIEPDASAASYVFAAAAICGGTVRVEGLGSDSCQGDVRFVDALRSMGALVEVTPESIEVTGGPLHGITADFSDISDTAQTIAAVAAFAEGDTRITGIGFIRAKETDRIAAVVAELRRCGIEAVEEPDGFLVHPGRIHPAVVQTYDDHRMAMSFSLLGLRSAGIEIADPTCVTKTFPTFFEVLESVRPEPT